MGVPGEGPPDRCPHRGPRTAQGPGELARSAGVRQGSLAADSPRHRHVRRRFLRSRGDLPQPRRADQDRRPRDGRRDRSTRADAPRRDRPAAARGPPGPPRTALVRRGPAIRRSRGRSKEGFDPASHALVVSVDDAASFMKVLDDLAGRANQYLRDREKTNEGPAAGGRKADPPMLSLEKLPAPSRGYRLTSPAHLVFWLNEDVQPTILVGKSHVSLAINPERTGRSPGARAGRPRPMAADRRADQGVRVLAQ